MPTILLEGTTTDVSTLSNVLAFIKSIFTAVLSALGSIYTTITSTPLLFVVVVISFAGAVIFAALNILHRLGVGGGRRGRRRARR